MNTPILSQNTRNNKVLKDVAAPDTDSRAIELIGHGLTVVPDMMYDHTRMQYTSPPGNVQLVHFNSPINWEDVTLHTLVIDNTNNSTEKTFQFNYSHIFMDDITNTTNRYVVDAGKRLVWFGTLRNGFFHWRISAESTN